MNVLDESPTLDLPTDQSTNVDTSRVLALLTPAEVSAFFPDHDLGEVVREFSGRVSPAVDSEQELEHLLEVIRPEVLVGAWTMPALPIFPDRLPVRYYCHLAGSVRKQVTRSHLEQGLLVSNWGTTAAPAVAESALTLALASLKNLTTHQMHLHLRQGWRQSGTEPQKSLIEARVGIHGFGAIGREVAKLLTPFRARIEVWDPYVGQEVLAEHSVRRSESLDALFAGSDVFFECCALTPETRGLVNEQKLALLPDGAVYVNTARGLIDDEAALAQELRSRRIAAGLDVFATEPLPGDSPLRGLENLVLTPHMGGKTAQARKAAGAFALQNLRRYFSGETPEALVSLANYDRST